MPDGKLPDYVASQIEEFLTDNPGWAKLKGVRQGGVILSNWEEILSAEDKLDAYLAWNGVHAFTDSIITVMEALGWKRNSK